MEVREKERVQRERKCHVRGARCARDLIREKMYGSKLLRLSFVLCTITSQFNNNDEIGFMKGLRVKR